MDWPEAVRKGELWAAGLNALALATLVLTRSWWREDAGSVAGRSGTDDPGRHGPGPASGRGRRRRDGRFLAAVILIVLLAGALRWRFAHSSLWWDEVWQARHASLGDWKPDRRHPGELRFVRTTWSQAFWNYRKPTNHPPMAVTSKACHEIWSRVTGAEPGRFNEWVLRLPGFGASLGAVAMIAFLLRAWGLPGAGLVAAFFLAIHPWHIRYGIDGRGYSFLVPLTLLGLHAVWSACGPWGSSGGARAGTTAGLRGSGARQSGAWWWVFGVTQGLILWCHPLSLWVCAGLAAAGIWGICRNHRGPPRTRRLARFIAVQLVGAMLFLQLFAPNLLQAASWGSKNQDGMLLDGPHLLATLTQLACGTEDPVPPPAAPSHPATAPAPTPLAPGAESHHSARWALAFVAVWCGWGVLRARRDHPALAVLTVSLIASCVCFLSVVAAAGFYFYPRFVFSMIVPTSLLLGAGVASGVARGWMAFTRGSVTARVWFAALGAVLMGLSVRYGQIVSPVISLLQQTPCTPLRETAAALRAGNTSGARILGYGFGAEALQYYLPGLKYTREAPARPALETALDEAQAAGQPLLVAVGYEAMNRQNVPDGFGLLDDPAVFAEDSKRVGLDPQFTFRILKSPPPDRPPER